MAAKAIFLAGWLPAGTGSDNASWLLLGWLFQTIAPRRTNQ